MRNFQWYHASILLALAWTAPSGATPLTLREALTFALEHSPDFNTAQRQAEIAELQRKNAISSFLPSLDLSAVHGLSKTYSGAPRIGSTNPTDPWQSQVGLTLTETFYDNGVSLLNFEKAKLARESALLSQNKVRDQLCLNVTVDYYQYSANHEVRDVSEQQLRNLEKQFASVSDQYQQGFKTRADFLRLKTQVQRARLALVDAETSLATSIVQLRKDLGSIEEQGTEKLEFQTVDPSQLPTEIPTVRLSPEQTYDVRLARLQKKTSEIDVTLSQRSYWPQILVNSQLNYGYSNYLKGAGEDTISPTTAYGGNLLLTLNFNLFDWGLRRRNVHVAEAGLLIQDNQVQNTVINSTATLESLRLSFNQLKSQYKLSRDLLNLEQENFALIRENYQEGKAQYLDLINSLNDLLFAKTAYLQAAYGVAQNLAKYRFYEGDIYASISNR